MMIESPALDTNGRPGSAFRGDFIMHPGHRSEVASDSPLELRVEVYTDGELPSSVTERIGALLAQRWPVEWDVTIPPHTNFEHPAEWRAIVPYPEGTTPEILHRQLAADLLAIDPARPLRFRTRWDYPQEPNHQEVYEEHWRPRKR
jgi:hypothetical protein